MTFTRGICWHRCVVTTVCIHVCCNSSANSAPTATFDLRWKYLLPKMCAGYLRALYVTCQKECCGFCTLLTKQVRYFLAVRVTIISLSATYNITGIFTYWYWSPVWLSWTHCYHWHGWDWNSRHFQYCIIGMSAVIGPPGAGDVLLSHMYCGFAFWSLKSRRIELFYTMLHVPAVEILNGVVKWVFGFLLT